MSIEQKNYELIPLNDGKKGYTKVSIEDYPLLSKIK